jgi:hypothetical protein
MSVEDANASEARIAARQFISSLGQRSRCVFPLEIKALKARVISVRRAIVPCLSFGTKSSKPVVSRACRAKHLLDRHYEIAFVPKSGEASPVAGKILFVRQSSFAPPIPLGPSDFRFTHLPWHALCIRLRRLPALVTPSSLCVDYSYSHSSADCSVPRSRPKPPRRL